MSSRATECRNRVLHIICYVCSADAANIDGLEREYICISEFEHVRPLLFCKTFADFGKKGRRTYSFILWHWVGLLEADVWAMLLKEGNPNLCNLEDDATRESDLHCVPIAGLGGRQGVLYHPQ